MLFLSFSKRNIISSTGAVGGPKWDNVEFSKKPERALLKLRKELKLFANLRPAICFKQLVDASTLKPEIVSGLDILIVRELTGGIYFGEPRGIKPIENGERKGINTHTYTSNEIIRVARVAFDLAKKLFILSDLFKDNAISSKPSRRHFFLKESILNLISLLP